MAEQTERTERYGCGFTEVRNYVIEHPASVNGNPASAGTAWVEPGERARNQNVVHVTFYGDGRYGSDWPELLPGYVHAALQRIADRVEWVDGRPTLT